jgi:hypothetical protein
VKDVTAANVYTLNPGSEEFEWGKFLHPQPWV